MAAVWKWFTDALATVFKRNGLAGVAVVVGLLLVVFAALVITLVYTPIGAFVAEWIRGG